MENIQPFRHLTASRNVSQLRSIYFSCTSGKELKKSEESSFLFKADQSDIVPLAEPRSSS